MKFVCLKCETYMAFQNVEAPAEGRLGITFSCGSCGARFSMVTNPGETQLVSSLGVTLGGRTEPPAPLELTRATLRSEAPAASATMAAYLAARAEQAAAVAGTTEKAAGCPFGPLVRELGLGAEAAPAGEPIDPRFSDAALAQLAVLPENVRHVLKRSVQDFAREHRFAVITPEVITAARKGNAAIDWSAEASERLQNIPDFVRAMARREIERLARSRGATTVSAEVMDEAKDLFGGFSVAG